MVNRMNTPKAGRAAERTKLERGTKFRKVAARVPQVAALQVLLAGVKQKRRVAIRYRDQERSRVVEPHVIYTDNQREVVAECYQIRGYSAAGRPTPFWRPFRIKKIAEAALLNESFAPRFREGFSPEKVKYRTSLMAMVGEQTESFVLPGVAPEAAGPPLPKIPRRR